MTSASHEISFGPFRLDRAAVRLWKGSEAVPLQPRPLAVLCYLAARPGEVVGRDELIARLWEGTCVTKAVLKVAVRAIREALDDAVAAPRYIETVGRTGYRFIGAGGVATSLPGAAATPGGASALVGRQAELAVMRRALERAEQGARTLLVVSGDAGVGKTTLVDRFLDGLGHDGEIWVARGQCLEQYGESEAYLPILDALGRLARDERLDELRQILRRHAPTWASQLPVLAAHDGAARSRGDAQGARPTRMLRELGDALEVAAQARTLVIVLEDLQWSDRATVDVLAFLARRREPARLLLIGTTRAAELVVHQHPLRPVVQELQANGLCEELAVELLAPAEVAAYVAARFPGAPAATLRRLAARIHQRTEGNALFMVNVVNDLVAGGEAAWRDGRWQVSGAVDAVDARVPLGLQELIGQRVQGLGKAARRALEAASVVGDEFAVASVAAALDEDAETVEDVCEQLAAQGVMIAEAGVAEWPDGSLTGRYRFLHALYRHVLYQGISAARRVRLHRAIGLREEAGFGAAAAERAAQLAMHFTRGREPLRALGYHELAVAAALDRQAPHEAVAQSSAALEALARVPEAPRRRARELELVVTRATLLMATRGYAAPQTVRDFAHARALCAALPDGPDVYPVLRGLLSYQQVRGQLADALDLGDTLLRHARRAGADRELRVQAHYGHGTTLFHVGALAECTAHLDAALRDYEPAQHALHARLYGGYDPGVACGMWLAWALALQGRIAEAVIQDREAMARARQLPDAFTLAFACYASGVSQQIFGDGVASERCSAEAAALAEEHGFPYVLGMATANRGWALITQGRAAEGIAILRDGVGAVEATGAGLMRGVYQGMLATADALQGDRAAALRRFDEGLADAERSGERLHVPALLIGKSRLLSGGGPGGRASRAAADEAEACLRRAIDVAGGQGARLVGLRAALALARHCRAQDRDGEGRAALAAAHAWFDEHPAAVPEIAAARALLAQ